MPRVLISAGHTMMDPGAIYGDLREADLTRKIAPMVLEALRQSGLEVQAVPLDLPLPDRIQWINSSGLSAEAGDILVEMHVNDADSSKRGLEIWYEGVGGNESEKVGVCIADSVTTQQGVTSNGVRSEQDHDLGSLRFLNATLPHASVVEVLYIDNQEDIQFLKDDNRLRNIAQSIADGIAKYCGRKLDGSVLADLEKPNFVELISKYSIKPTGKPKLPFGGFGMDPFNDDFDDLMSDPFAPPTDVIDTTIVDGNAIISTFGDTITPAGVQTAISAAQTVSQPLAAPIANFGASTNNPVPAANNPFATPTTNPTANLKPFAPQANNPFVPAANNPFAPTSNNSFAPGGGTAPGLGASTFMDREKRKKMIEDTYLKVLGIKAEDRDLNTYLNKGISEAELTQKLIESDQHTNLVKSKDEIEQLRKDKEGSASKLTKLQTTVRDMQEMIAQLNRLLVHKNEAIKEMEKTFSEHKGLPSEVYQNIQTQKKAALPANQNSVNSVKLDNSKGDGIKRRFAKRFS